MGKPHQKKKSSILRKHINSFMSSRTRQAGRFGKESHGQAAAFKFMDTKVSDIRHIHFVTQLPATEFPQWVSDSIT